MVFKSVDIYSDAFYESTLLRVKKRVDDERFEHILSVSATCELLAKV